MKTHPIQPPLPRHLAKGGSAIIIALLMITLVTLVVLAAFVRSDSGSKVSRFGKEAGLASLYAQDGVAQAVALLRYATDTPTIPWTSQPGQVIRYTPDGPETVALHSGLAASAATGGNLNQPSIQNPTEGTMLGDSGAPLLAQWIYVRKNGARSLDSTFDEDNRIIGRYAFWTDDEGAKLNVNTAWSESNAINTVNPPSHPSRLPLTRILPTLENSDLAAIANYRSSSRYFNTSLELLKGLGTADDEQAATIREAKFHLTPVNTSPSTHLTSFGQPKIVLTTNPDRAKAADGTQLPYLDLTDALASRTLLRGYLARIDWSMAPGKSFQEKYYSGDVGRLDQLAGNIIDYVRCKEFSDEIVKPSRYSPPSSTKVHAPPTRRWRMVEAGFWRSTATPTQGRLYVVVHLPRHAGLASFKIENWRVSIIVSSTNAQNLIYLPTVDLEAGDYALLSVPCTVPTTGSVFNANLKFYRRSPDGSYDMFDVYPSSSANSNSEHIPWPITDIAPAVTAPTTPESTAGILTVKVHDPSLGGARGDWSTPGANRFTQLPDHEAMRGTGPLGKAPDNPELGQDLDASGLVTDEGIIFPPPAGTTGNPRGAVESLAELGRIHTGLQVDGQPSVPFRSVRLQPRQPGSSEHLQSVPDWLLLDLFALPNLPGDTQNALLNRPGGKGGLINVNSDIEPFSSLSRTRPLEALLKTNPLYSDSMITSTVENIRTRSAASGTYTEGVLTGDHYRYVGELAEIAGIADGGESSEANLSGVVDLASTRSGVYSVWSIGQSIVQGKDGNITVRASSSRVSYLERTESSGTVHFRLLQSTPLGVW